MPTIGVKRDLLFNALGKKYSKFQPAFVHVELCPILMFTPFLS